MNRGLVLEVEQGAQANGHSPFTCEGREPGSLTRDRGRFET